MRLRRQRNRRIRDAGCKLPDGVACTRLNNQDIQQLFGANRLRIKQGVDNFLPTHFFNFHAKVSRFPKAGIYAISRLRHDRHNMHALLQKHSHLREHLGKGAKGAAHRKAGGNLTHV